MTDSKQQGCLRIGDTAPNFDCDSSSGPINFHKYIDKKWAILFSHPRDFTPVCTTEIGTLARIRQQFDDRGCVVAVVSVDSAEEHKKWIKEINRVEKTEVNFPILGDEKKKIAMLYGMLDQTHLDQTGLPLTVRSVYIIGPDKKVKLIITYPASTGRNFDEIVRVLDSLILTATRSVATPADWKMGDKCVLLPSVSDEDAKKYEGLEVVSASCKLRKVPCPKLHESKQISVTLNTGARMPILGYGTFLAKPGEVAAGVEEALKVGYRHIDCAECYDNQTEIGEVFKRVFSDANSGIKREDVFITSKLWISDFKPSSVRPALQKCLKDLQLGYLDLWLMHIPVACVKQDGETVAGRRLGYSLHDTWVELEKAHKEGLCKSIGVSNFPAVLINDFQNKCEIVPAVNQIERHPYLAQFENVAFHKELGISITAYAPLGAVGLMGDKFTDLKAPLQNAAVLAVAAKHKKTPAQVLIRWSVDQGVVVIPKSVTASRIAENFNVFDFKLDEEDMKSINALDVGFRTFAQDWMGVPCFK